MKYELARKGLHVLIALSFAFLATFLPKEQLIAIALGLFVMFAILRLARLTTCVHRVARVTFGEFFFVLGLVASLYMTLPGNLLLFQLSMAVLAFADPLAALIGIRFGKHQYMVFDEKRSYEGSLACAVASFTILVLFGASFTQAVPIALLLALVEALALRGSDNLFLPTSAIYLYQFFVI